MAEQLEELEDMLSGSLQEAVFERTDCFE